MGLDMMMTDSELDTIVKYEVKHGISAILANKAGAIGNVASQEI